MKRGNDSIAEARWCCAVVPNHGQRGDIGELWEVWDQHGHASCHRDA
jgi:hypothetical protein